MRAQRWREPVPEKRQRGGQVTKILRQRADHNPELIAFRPPAGGEAATLEYFMAVQWTISNIISGR